MQKGRCPGHPLRENNLINVVDLYLNQMKCISCFTCVHILQISPFLIIFLSTMPLGHTIKEVVQASPYLCILCVAPLMDLFVLCVARLWSSVYECQRVECAFASPVRTECGLFVMCYMQRCVSVSAVL